VSFLILVVDDESDVKLLFPQQFRRDLRDGRFAMEFALSAQGALRSWYYRQPNTIDCYRSVARRLPTIC
jgi:hypothetical protein